MVLPPARKIAPGLLAIRLEGNARASQSLTGGAELCALTSQSQCRRQTPH